MRYATTDQRAGRFKRPVRRAVATGLAAVAIGCDTTPRVERGGTAVVGGYVDIRTMNPFATITDLNKAFERYALYMPLVMLDSTLTPRPWLAMSWDTAAAGADSLDITFH